MLPCQPSPCLLHIVWTPSGRKKKKKSAPTAQSCNLTVAHVSARAQLHCPTSGFTPSAAHFEQELAGSLQSLCWASAAVGGIASAYFSGSLVQDYGPRFVFGVTALFPLVVSGAALLITEQPAPPVDTKAAAGWPQGQRCLVDLPAELRCEVLTVRPCQGARKLRRLMSCYCADGAF